MKFEKVTEEHVRRAVADLRRGLPEGFGASNYFDVEVDGELHPPKALMAYANLHATGEPPKNNFKGGRRTECFNAFERLGFRVIPRSNPNHLDTWIDRYIQLISDQSADNSYNELYKWQAVRWFQDHWKENFDASEVFQLVKTAFAKTGNLLRGAHFFPLAMLEEMASVKPEETVGALHALFDENRALDLRLANFEKFGDWFITQNRPDVANHYQSRRAMMAYLAMRYPGNYALYKNGMFNKFCELTQFWPRYGSAKKGSYDVVLDFMSMCNSLKGHLLSHPALMRAHQSRIPDDLRIEDDTFLLVQDFIHSVGAYLMTEPEQMEEKSMKEGIREAFRDWLIGTQNFTSGAASSYLKAIEVLESYFSKKVYNEKDIGELEVLYSDLIENQKVANGKYHYPQAPSYGEKGFFSASIDQFIQFLNRPATPMVNTGINQIFFGPPGTGKTFNTINEAIRIVDPEFFAQNESNRESIRNRFNELLIKDGQEEPGQIGFTTFHQSMSYEDFIEGIKPMGPQEGDEFLKYEIQDGIFKNLCRLASDSAEPSLDQSNFGLTNEEYVRTAFFKLSLGNTLDSADDEVYEYCIENDCISIGFGNGLDFTSKNEAEIRGLGAENQMGSYDVTAVNLFVNHLHRGSMVIVSNGNRYIRAIGKVVGDCEYISESPFANNPHWKLFRKVDWLYHGRDIPAQEFYRKNLSQQTIYKLDKREIKRDFFAIQPQLNNSHLPKNYVLIIDEINRGNVSSIFGELITLIEPNKRAGSAESLEVTLPYSKSTFSVPSNLYIIGTMNTADRSVEALDSALRRRFAFKEMAPDSSVIAKYGKLKSTNGIIEPQGANIDLPQILDAINARIEILRDKDYRIGHSYLMEVETHIDLVNAFKDKIIPLLEEYFFSDLGKLSLILGRSFVSAEGDAHSISFAKDNDYDALLVNELQERKVYRLASSANWDFKHIYA